MIVTSYKHQKVPRTLVQVDFDLVQPPRDRRPAQPAEADGGRPHRAGRGRGRTSRVGWPPVEGWLNQIKIDLNHCPEDFLMII